MEGQTESKYSHDPAPAAPGLHLSSYGKKHVTVPGEPGELGSPQGGESLSLVRWVGVVLLMASSGTTGDAGKFRGWYSYRVQSFLLTPSRPHLIKTYVLEGGRKRAFR